MTPELQALARDPRAPAGWHGFVVRGTQESVIDGETTKDGTPSDGQGDLPSALHVLVREQRTASMIIKLAVAGALLVTAACSVPPLAVAGRGADTCKAVQS